METREQTHLQRKGQNTMTLQELYASFGENCDQALRVLRMEKLVDKHIRKLPTNGVIDALLAAGETMDPVRLFEAAHAAKGVCGNLGLKTLSDMASEIAEEYRPGNARSLSDAQVGDKLAEIAALYRRTAEGIRQYEGN